MINFYVRHGMVVEKFHEIVSFKQSKWLEKKLLLVLKNETELKMVKEKTSETYLLILVLVIF